MVMLLPTLLILNIVNADPSPGWGDIWQAVKGAASTFTRGGYRVNSVGCPDNADFLKYADGLSGLESEWLDERDKVTGVALEEWLSNSGLEDFDASKFLSQGKVRVALAFSGGGYRAMLSGAGQFAAFDGRTEGSKHPGHMGGLVEASTFLAGLSGGGWLVSSLVVNNWTTTQALIDSPRIWNFTSSLIFSAADSSRASTSLYTAVASQVFGKAYSNSDTRITLTDIYGRLLGYQLFDADDGGVSLKYHSVRESQAFKTHQMPFPIHVAVGRAPGTQVISINSTNFEINPFYLGSWDPNVYAFTDIKYLATKVSNGKPVGGECRTGFDSSSFLTATSASLFNQILGYKTGNSIFQKVLDYVGGVLNNNEWDISAFKPNPFYEMEHVDNSITRATELSLVDGGLDGQNIPLHPLIQPEREVDVIFAMDNSANTRETDPDGANWPNGESLVSTYERQFSDQGNGTKFPYVPDKETFLYGGLTKQPTFFGCNRDNLTSLFDDSVPESSRHYPPVIIYMANTEHSFKSNTSTLAKLSYTDDEFRGMIGNGYNLVTQNNGTLDNEWRSCVACAVILREQQRRGESPTEQCQKCFDKYCWDGTYATQETGKAARRDGQINPV